jgi:replication fork clamp-binding protein CrfC
MTISFFSKLNTFEIPRKKEVKKLSKECEALLRKLMKNLRKNLFHHWHKNKKV